MPINARLGRTEQSAGLPSTHSSAPSAVSTLWRRESFLTNDRFRGFKRSGVTGRFWPSAPGPPMSPLDPKRPDAAGRFRAVNSRTSQKTSDGAAAVQSCD